MASIAPSNAPDEEDREPAGGTSLTGYQRWLIGFLCVATFFEGYDLFALAQILPNLRADFGLEPSYAGLLISITSVGNVLVRVCTEDIPPLAEVAPWVPRRVSTIVDKALAKDPKNENAAAGLNRVGTTSGLTTSASK